MPLPAANSFLRWGEYLTGRIRWATATLGQRAVGYIALLNDQIAEGMRSAFVASLPGHPEQARDSLDTVGHSRDLILYPGETQDIWSTRVLNAWTDYEQGGTPQAVVKGVNDWGRAILPDFWDATAYVTESSWARFQTVIPYGNTGDNVTFAWLPAYTYGSGRVYGPAQDYFTDSVIYGLDYAAADEEIEPIALQLDLLRRTIRKWKPVRSKGTIKIVLDAESHFYGEPGLVYGPEYRLGTIARRIGAGLLSIPYPEGITAGDLLIIHEARNAGTDSPPTGYTLIATKAGGFFTIRIYAKIADGTEDEGETLDWTVTGTGDHAAKLFAISPPVGGWNTTVENNFTNIVTFAGVGDNTIAAPDNTEDKKPMLYFLVTEFFDQVLTSSSPFWTELYEETGNINLTLNLVYGSLSGVTTTVVGGGSNDIAWIGLNLNYDQLLYHEGNFFDLKV